MIFTDPMGPGFFIFFIDPIDSSDPVMHEGPDRRYQEDQDLLVLIHAFLQMEDQ